MNDDLKKSLISGNRNFVQNGDAELRFGTGESMFRAVQRIYNLLDDLRMDDKTYILVAHNGIARFVKSYFQDMTNEDFAKFGIQNAEVCEFEF